MAEQNYRDRLIASGSSPAITGNFPEAAPRIGRLPVILGLAALAAVVLIARIPLWTLLRADSRTPDFQNASAVASRLLDRKAGNSSVHFDEFPASLKDNLIPTSLPGNIRPNDYAGADACRGCHAKQYASWLTHPHRFMNAVVTEANVMGDFFGIVDIVYQGVRGTFHSRDGEYGMNMEQDGLARTYAINQTIGSRFFQYYIGVGDGPTPPGHHELRRNHVLPFEYWIDREMWVPVVHVSAELPDEGNRWNPCHPRPGRSMSYEHLCSNCHMTVPFGDLMIHRPLVGTGAAVGMFLDGCRYLHSTHPEIWPGRLHTSADLHAVVKRMLGFSAPDKAMHGITCEACHFGARAHAEGLLPKPSFLLQGDHRHIPVSVAGAQHGCTKQNLNRVYSRCHSGQRPRYAAGISTRNSTEYSDAIHSSCIRSCSASTAMNHTRRSVPCGRALRTRTMTTDCAATTTSAILRDGRRTLIIRLEAAAIDA